MIRIGDTVVIKKQVLLEEIDIALIRRRITYGESVKMTKLIERFSGFQEVVAIKLRDDGELAYLLDSEPDIHFPGEALRKI